MLKQIKNKNNIRIGVALSATLAVLALPLVNTFAYGPERATFTGEKPADYVTFNSITNNPHMGDERNFVRIREAGNGNYVDSINIVPGKEYEVWTHYHNNAASTLNDKEHNFKGIALDTKLRANLPHVVKKGQTLRVLSEISASNSKPLKVWDEATISSPSRDVALRYIQGSAHIISNGKINGMGLPADKLFGEGANLGYDALNGAVPGCTEFSGTVIYKFKADYADFEMSKTVSLHGKNQWVKNQTAQAGEKVDFKITYKNIGTMTQNNVNIKDLLPKGMTLVKGTTRISHPSQPSEKTLSDNVVGAGINIGNYSIDGSATLIFTAQIDPVDKLVCGSNTLTNTAQVKTENGGKSDTATVTVRRDCTPGQTKDQCKIVGKGDLKANDPKCSEQCKIKGFEHLKADDKNCAEIPSELPKTGPAEAAMMFISITVITGAIAYWFRSHEEMKKITADVGLEVEDHPVVKKVKAIKAKIQKK